MTRGQYLCGCWPEEKIGYSSAQKRLDSEGFEVCPEHGYRLYGWKSHFTEKPGLGRVIDYSKEARGSSSLV